MQLRVPSNQTIRTKGPALYTQVIFRLWVGFPQFGLALIPGAWIQSIQLTKGPGSVVNGAGAMVARSTMS